LAWLVLLKIVYVLTCRVLGLAVLVFRSDLAKDAELPVLRHENAVLRRHAGRVRYEPADRAPRMNAICERLVGTLRRELPDRVLILGEAHLRTVLAEYQAHYSTARPHQGIAQRIPDGGGFAVVGLDHKRLHRRPVLGGLINEYSSAA
jgi:transposase InsO family protein